MPIVEKQSDRSTGTYSSPSSRASENSFSNVACSTAPRSASRSDMRRRKWRGQCSQGSKSSR